MQIHNDDKNSLLSDKKVTCLFKSLIYGVLASGLHFHGVTYLYTNI